MPVYTTTSGFADHRRHPNVLILIVAGHAALLAAVMTAKMEVISQFVPQSTEVQLIPLPQPPSPDKPPPPERKERVEPRVSRVDQSPIVVPIPNQAVTTFDSVPLPLPDPAPIGTGTETVPTPVPVADSVRIAARFNTPERLIKPPYPLDKQRLEEEATLRLKLSIDERGRVMAVEPIGRIDRSFFEAARRHLIANWRYKPATVDGRAVPSSTVISLTFRIE